MPARDFLQRRNALWQRLRCAPPHSPEFGAALQELAVLTRWPRARLLAGLGLMEEAKQAEAEAAI